MQIGRGYQLKKWYVEMDDYPFEFFMNRLRLVEACPHDEYQIKTGESLPSSITTMMNKAQDNGLLSIANEHWQVTPLGRRYLNTLLEQLVD